MERLPRWLMNPPANARDAGDVGLIPGLGRSPGRGNGNPPPVFLPGMEGLVPCPGAKPRPPALGVWSFSHWTPGRIPSRIQTQPWRKEAEDPKCTVTVSVTWSSTGLNRNYVCFCLATKSRLTLVQPLEKRALLQPTRLLCPWDFPGKNTGVGCISFSRESSLPRDRARVSCTVRQILYH